MNKKQLIKEMADVSGLNIGECKKAIDAFIEISKKKLSKGDRLVMYGFGTFKRVLRSARIGLNPATLERVTVPARHVVRFSAGKPLINSVREGDE